MFVPEYAEPTKIARIRGFGAEVVVVGDRFSATVAAAREHGGHTGAVLVHPYDDRETVVGQGTLGAELEEQMPDLDVLVVAVGGGGLIGGISAWYGTRIRIVAVESAGTPTLATAWDGGPEATTEVSGIAASSLGAPSIGSICYGMVRERIERPILVSDAEILDAQRRLWAAARLIGEPGGVAALAALTSRRFTPQPGERVGVLVCGGNADPNWFKV